MSRDLFFLPLIARARQARDCLPALTEALGRISEQGREPGHEVGWEQFLDFAAAAGTATAVECDLVRDSEAVATVRLTPGGHRAVVAQVTPGHYCLVQRTGRVLWEGQIRDSDLYWGLAWPGRPLELAAATDDTAAPVSLTEVIMGGEIKLSVYPGLESGMIGLELR